MAPTPATRRALLARAAPAAVALASASAPVLARGAVVEPVDPHPAWAAEIARLYHLANHTPGIGDDDVSACMDQAGELEDLVAETPCATLAGAAAQVEVAARLVDDALEGWPVGDRAGGALGQVAALLARRAAG